MMGRRYGRVLAGLLMGLLAAAAMSGCKVDADDVSYWKRTVKGPGKLVAVIGSDRYSDELRTQAAMALVEMERNDVNGLSLLRKSLDDLQRTDPGAVKTIVGGMAPRLQALLAADPKSKDGAPPPDQVRAKDAAYMVIPFAQDTARSAMTKSVVSWYAKDFAGRSLAGDFSAEQVTRELGAPAQQMLVEALDAKMPQQALVKIAEIIGQGGDKNAKRKAATRLVDIEKQMESRGFLDWLRREITESYKSQGATVKPEQVTEAAVLNRENYINNGALPAMKYVADVPDVSARLVQIANTKPGPNDTKAWKARLNARRGKALQALEGNATRKHLRRLLSIALDPSNTNEVRDYAFDRVSDIRSKEAIPQLWPLFQRDGCVGSACSEAAKLDKRLRWRAGEMILGIGGRSVITEFLRRMPAPAGVHYEPEELEGYATRLSQMTPPPTRRMVGELSSPRWWNRVIGLRYLERRGRKDHEAAISKLKRDGAKVAGEGWSKLDPPATTVGKVAESSLTALRARLQDDNKKK